MSTDMRRTLPSGRSSASYMVLRPMVSERRSLVPLPLLSASMNSCLSAWEFISEAEPLES